MPRRKPDDIHHSQEEAQEVREQIEDASNMPIENSEEEGEDLQEEA